MHNNSNWEFQINNDNSWDNYYEKLICRYTDIDI